MTKLLHTKFSPLSYYCLPLKHEHLLPPPPPITTTTTTAATTTTTTTTTILLLLLLLLLLLRLPLLLVLSADASVFLPQTSANRFSSCRPQQFSGTCGQRV